MTVTTTAFEHNRVKSSELRPYDLVIEHGMRVRLPAEPTRTADPTVWAGTVENLDEVRAGSVVPSSFVTDGKWTVQGNDGATWTVERDADDRQITVADPDDPHGSPAYDGPAIFAGAYLVPGRYQALDHDGNELRIVVREHPGDDPAACIICGLSTDETTLARIGEREGRICPDCAYHSDGNLVVDGAA